MYSAANLPRVPNLITYHTHPQSQSLVHCPARGKVQYRLCQKCWCYRSVSLPLTISWVVRPGYEISEKVARIGRITVHLAVMLLIIVRISIVVNKINLLWSRGFKHSNCRAFWVDIEFESIFRPWQVRSAISSIAVISWMRGVEIKRVVLTGHYPIVGRKGK